MKIANPIYDAVFKYLMEDNNIAKDILSILLSIKIVSLELRPIEYTKKFRGKLRVYRIDFKAVIQVENGKLLTVLIEIQKASKEGEGGFARFRRYLGDSYATSERILVENKPSKSQNLPIIAVYFLGFPLKGIETPILKIERTYTDGLTGKPLSKTTKAKFVEQLSHDLIAIQIPRLRMDITHESEAVLDVFNQNYQTANPAILEYTRTPVDERVQRILYRLNLALQDEHLFHILREEEIIAQEEEERLAKEARRAAKREAKLAKQEAKLERQEAKIERRNAQLLALREESKEARKAEEEARKAEEEARKAEEKARKAEEKARLLAEQAQAEIELLRKQLAAALEQPKD
jgi:hypothetical protein